MNKCPLEIITQILLYLPGRDIFEFSFADKYTSQIALDSHLWSSLLSKRFKKHDILTNPIKLYMELERKCSLLYGSELFIVWTDGRHWRLQGTTAVLDMVWWLQVDGNFYGLLKGIYEPILDLEFVQAYGLNTMIVEIYQLDVDKQQDLLTTFAFTNVQTSDGRVQLKLPRVYLEGSSDYYDLRVSIREFDAMNMVSLFLNVF